MKFTTMLVSIVYGYIFTMVPTVCNPSNENSLKESQQCQLMQLEKNTALSREETAQLFEGYSRNGAHTQRRQSSHEISTPIQTESAHAHRLSQPTSPVRFTHKKSKPSRSGPHE